MTVFRYTEVGEDTLVVCHWFRGEEGDDLAHGYFPEEALESVPD